MANKNFNCIYFVHYFNPLNKANQFKRIFIAEIPILFPVRNFNEDFDGPKDTSAVLIHV